MADWTLQSRLRLGAAIALVASVALALAPAPAAASGRPLVTGISDPDSTDLAVPLVYQRIRDAGARFVRLTFLWQAIAPQTEPTIPWDPTNPGDVNYNWSLPDREVRQTVDAGLTPVVQIYTAPRWAQRCQQDNPQNAPCDPDPNAAAQFAEAAARRYRGDFLDLPRVRYWELMNEPNLATYFHPQFRDGKPISPVLFRVLQNAFTGAIKGVAGSNLVLGPDMAPLKGTGALAPLDFMRRMLCMQGRRHPRPSRACHHRARFDIWATNPYTSGGPTHHAAGADEVSLGDLPEMRRLIRAAERAGRIDSDLHPVPFWITEFSWDSKPPDPGGLPWRIHARWAAEAIYRAWKAGVSAFFWNKLRDQDQNAGPDYFAQSGLYLRGASLAEDKPKRVLSAFRFPFVAFTAAQGVRVWGRTPTSQSGQVAIEVRKGDRWLAIATLRANRFGIFQRVVDTGYGRRKRGLVRAKYGDRVSLPFSLHYVHDFYVPPFGATPSESRP
jgi:hypothetical protein